MHNTDISRPNNHTLWCSRSCSYCVECQWKMIVVFSVSCFLWFFCCLCKNNLNFIICHYIVIFVFCFCLLTVKSMQYILSKRILLMRTSLYCSADVSNSSMQSDTAPRVCTVAFWGEHFHNVILYCIFLHCWWFQN